MFASSGAFPAPAPLPCPVPLLNALGTLRYFLWSALASSLWHYDNPKLNELYVLFLSSTLFWCNRGTGSQSTYLVQYVLSSYSTLLLLCANVLSNATAPVSHSIHNWRDFTGTLTCSTHSHWNSPELACSWTGKATRLIFLHEMTFDCSKVTPSHISSKTCALGRII